MLDFLPQKIKEGLAHLNANYLYEIRIRANQPITVNFKGKYRYLGARGITERRSQALLCDLQDIADCVYRAGEYSVYSVEEQLKQGFLTAKNGERIGIAGEYVFERGQPFALRNFTSLCVRVPHEIIGSGAEIFHCCMSDRVRSILIMSPPGLGKTTILRDLGRIISEKMGKNVLICDERGEISAGTLGETCDIVKFCDKATAFESGIRAMRPEIIITDELSAKDCEALAKAIYAGITVLASAHFSSMESVQKPFLGLFERFVLLDAENLGCIKSVYNENGREMLL